MAGQCRPKDGVASLACAGHPRLPHSKEKQAVDARNKVRA
jgi:hypothetical protein